MQPHPASSAVGGLILAWAAVLLVPLPQQIQFKVGKGPHPEGRPACGVHAAPLALGFLLLLGFLAASFYDFFLLLLPPCVCRNF